MHMKLLWQFENNLTKIRVDNNSGPYTLLFKFSPLNVAFCIALDPGWLENINEDRN